MEQASSYNEWRMNMGEAGEPPYGKAMGPAEWDWDEFNRVYQLARPSWSGPWTAQMSSAEVARRCIGNGDDLAGSAARVAAFIDAARAYYDMRIKALTEAPHA